MKTVAVLCVFLAGCASFEGVQWRRYDVGYFTLELPAGAKQSSEKGIDSYVRSYKCKGLEIDFDFGRYSNNFGDWPALTEFETVTVDGRTGKIGTARESFGYQFQFSTQIAFRDVYPPWRLGTNEMRQHLSVFASCRGLEELQMAKKIFCSIRFKSGIEGSEK